MNIPAKALILQATEHLTKGTDALHQSYWERCLESCTWRKL